MLFGNSHHVAQTTSVCYARLVPYLKQTQYCFSPAITDEGSSALTALLSNIVPLTTGVTTRYVQTADCMHLREGNFGAL